MLPRRQLKEFASGNRQGGTRQLQKALAPGPGPLHLAAMFGLGRPRPKTAIRYARNALQLLLTAAEEHDPAASGEPRIQSAHTA